MGERSQRSWVPGRRGRGCLCCKGDGVGKMLARLAQKGRERGGSARVRRGALMNGSPTSLRGMTLQAEVVPRAWGHCRGLKLEAQEGSCGGGSEEN